MVQVSPEFRRRIDAIPDRVREAAAREMEKLAEELVQDIIRAAPWDDKPDSIHLRENIGWTWGDAPAGSFTMGEIRGGADAGVEYATLRLTIYANPKDKHGRPYASWVEFGTTRSKARAFFWPAYRAKRPQIRRRIFKAIREAIRNG